MAAPKATVWELAPHTRAKHAILKRYLQAWMVILSQAKFPEILYIDGFAGPGEYDKGDPGSPVIALQTALDYRPPLTAKIHFLFVEKDKERSAHLKSLVDKMTLPANFAVIIEGGKTFEAAFGKHLPAYQRNGRLIPTFAFIDPFGWSGVPFSIVQQIMRQRSCEVFVNFMYDEINRFIGHPDQVSNFNEFFGTTAWEACKALTKPRERNRFLHDLYIKQMHEAAGIKYVRSFKMSNDKDVTDYFLFYGTNELLGLKKMKEAMWRVDESGEFRYSDATDPHQAVLFGNEPNAEQLKRNLLGQFKGKKAKVGEIEDFVVVHTAFRETHYKKVLKNMETATAEIAINWAPEGRKRGQYGSKDIVISFKP